MKFRWTYGFEVDGQVLTSDSTLRFREREEVERDLEAHGYVVDDVCDAPDRQEGSSSSWRDVRERTCTSSSVGPVEEDPADYGRSHQGEAAQKEAQQDPRGAPPPPVRQ